VLRELAEQKVIFIDMTSGALRELLQLYRNLNNYELDPLYAEEVEERLERGNTAHDLKIRTLNIGGTAVQLSKARLLSIPYFQAAKKFGKSHSMEFDRDSEAFLAYLQAKRNAKLTTPAARREAVFWGDYSFEAAPSSVSHSLPAPPPASQPVGQAPQQQTLTYITQEPQITFFKHIYRRHTDCLKRVHQIVCSVPEVEIELGAEYGIFGKLLLRGIAVDQIEHASIEFRDKKRFDYDTGILQIEAANIKSGNGDLVLFASLGVPWPLMLVPATIRLRLKTDCEFIAAVVYGELHSPDERARFAASNHEYLCRFWSSHRAKTLVLPRGGIVAIFVYNEEPVSGGVYHGDRLVSNLDEEISMRLPAGWHVISYALGRLWPSGRVYSDLPQPSGHLSSNGADYQLRLNRLCDIRLLEYGVLGIGHLTTPFTQTLAFVPPPPNPFPIVFPHLVEFNLAGNDSDEDDDGDLPVPL
jgi:hypothetical protein